MADDLDEELEEDDALEEPEDISEDDLEELDEDDIGDDEIGDEDLADDDIDIDEEAGEDADEAGDGTPAARTDTEEEEDEEDEEMLDEDVEASLDVILKERLVVQEEEDEEEDVPDVEERGDSSGKVLPKQPDEFVCQSCFLVKHPSQLADRDRMLCRDCV
jgi:hypothetical protein